MICTGDASSCICQASNIGLRDRHSGPENSDERKGIWYITSLAYKSTIAYLRLWFYVRLIGAEVDKILSLD